jgi:hypothetical protein
MCWGEAVNNTLYVRDRALNDSLSNWDNCNNYPALFSTPHKMLHAFAKPSHDNDSKKILQKAPYHHIS